MFFLLVVFIGEFSCPGAEPPSPREVLEHLETRAAFATAELQFQRVLLATDADLQTLVDGSAKLVRPAEQLRKTLPQCPQSATVRRRAVATAEALAVRVHRAFTVPLARFFRRRSFEVRTTVQNVQLVLQMLNEVAEDFAICSAETPLLDFPKNFNATLAAIDTLASLFPQEPAHSRKKKHKSLSVPVRDQHNWLLVASGGGVALLAGLFMCFACCRRKYRQSSSIVRKT
jgi:hypothetical protein